VFKNFAEKLTVKIEFPIEGVHGGALIGARGADFVVFYDWGDGRLVRRIDVGAPRRGRATRRAPAAAAGPPRRAPFGAARRARAMAPRAGLGRPLHATPRLRPHSTAHTHTRARARARAGAPNRTHTHT
jgi:hypothetical protein